MLWECWRALRLPVRYDPDILFRVLSYCISDLDLFAVCNAGCFLLFFLMLVGHNIMLVFKINYLEFKLGGSSQA